MTTSIQFQYHIIYNVFVFSKGNTCLQCDAIQCFKRNVAISNPQISNTMAGYKHRQYQVIAPRASHTQSFGYLHNSTALDGYYRYEARHSIYHPNTSNRLELIGQERKKSRTYQRMKKNTCTMKQKS
eukprot:79868_1